ncbi:hypothetical protein AB0A73_27985 [Glycomyces sp. NPDC047369]
MSVSMLRPVKQEPVGAPPLPREAEDATVHLCAAAYLDLEFRERVFREVYARRDRAVAPNPVCDAVPVLHHVRHARRIDFAQHAVLTIVLAAFTVAPGVNRPMLFACIMVWSVMGLRLRVTGSSLRISANPRRTVLNRILGKAAKRVGRPYPVLAAAVLALLLWIDAIVAVVPVWPAVAVLSLCRCGFEWVRLRRLIRIQRRIAPAREPDQRAAYVGAAQRGVVLVRRRERGRPYPGYGFQLESRSIAFGLEAREGLTGEPLPFTVSELHAALAEQVIEATSDSSLATGLAGLTVEERYFTTDYHFPRPVTGLADLAAGEKPTGAFPATLDRRVSRELRFRVPGVEDESVTCMFADFTLVGGVLSTRFTPCVLPPTRSEYHIFRDGPLRWKSAMAWSGLLAAASAPIDLLLSPVELLVRSGQCVADELRGRPALTGWRPPDAGARIGIRELGFDPDPLNHDVSVPVTYIQVLDQQILKALGAFLAERGFDTSALEDQMTKIVNYGVINNGEMTAGAVGPDAQATVGAVGQASTGTTVTVTAKRPEKTKPPKGKAAA